MIVTSATPQDLIEWFYRTDERHEILCIPLHADKNDVAEFTELFRRFNELDAALGERVSA